MTQNELQYILAIAEYQSITKAAEALYLSQPSLSQALQRIEKSLGAPLFQRGAGKSLKLTYAGRLYYEAARKILKIHSDVSQKIREYAEGSSGALRLGVSNQFGLYVLPSILPEYKRKYPQIEISIIEAPSHILMERLMEGDCDFAILNCAENDFKPQFHYEKLVTAPFVVVASQDNPVAELAVSDIAHPYPLLEPKMLQKIPFVMMLPGNRVRQVADRILNDAHITHPNIPFHVNNMQTLYTLIGNGMGISFSPSQYITSFLSQKLSVFSIPEEYNTQWTTCITTVQDGYLSPAAMGFIQMLRDFYANSMIITKDRSHG